MGQKPLQVGEQEKVIGKHVFGNLYECDINAISDEEYLRETVINAAKIAKMHLVEVRSWKFGGPKGGISVIALVTESHISIHSWIEYNYAAVDVYTCGSKSRPLKAFKYIVERLKPKHYNIKRVSRVGYKLE